jgi:hypothetical protein
MDRRGLEHRIGCAVYKVREGPTHGPHWYRCETESVVDERRSPESCHEHVPTTSLWNTETCAVYYDLLDLVP